MAERDLDLSGRTLGGFRLKKQIDHGGFGLVYLAEQAALRREVVVKVLRPDKSDGTTPERFHREAQLASRLNHAYSAQVHDFGIEEGGDLAGLHWIALELVPGVTLAARLQAQGCIPLEQVVPLFERIAEVVQEAHDLGIVHRDLKPSNIMVIERSGRLLPKLLDFGIAKVNHAKLFAEDHRPGDHAATLLIRGRPSPLIVDDTSSVASRHELTPRWARYGTASYMAPEQAVDSGAVGPRADIYALALVFCEALTGRLPIAVADDEHGRLELHLGGVVPPLGDDIPPMLARILRTALSKDPQDRQDTVKEFADQLSAVLRASDRGQLQTAAQLWKDRGHRPGMLLAGRELKRWTSDTSTQLTELECSFVAASQRRLRRNSWILRSLPLLAAIAVVAVVLFRSHLVEEAEKERAQLAQRAAEERAQLAQRTSEQIAIASAVEQGRQALLHVESNDAVHYLMEAYRRGEHSTGVEFMLGRALQPRMAERARFPSSSGRMWSAMFAPDGKRLLTTDDKSAQMWDATSKQLLFTMSHGDTVYQGIFSPDGSRIATAGGDGSVRIWNAATGAPLHELRYQRPGVKQWRYYAIAMSSHFVAAVDTMGKATHVWNAATGAKIAELTNDASEAASIALSTDGHWLAASGGDDVRVFDTSTWRCVNIIHGPRVRSLSFDATGPRLAVGTFDGEASIWGIPSGAHIRRLRESGEPVDALAFSRDGRLLAAGSRGGTAAVWDATSGALRTQFNSHYSQIYAVEFSPDGNFVLSAGADAVVVSNVVTGMPIARLEGPRGVIFTAHFDKESRHVVGASWDGTARIWDATSPYHRWGSPPIGAECDQAESLVPDQRFIAISCRSLGTRVWDTARDDLLADLPGVTPVDGDYSSAFPALTASGERAAIARGRTVEVYALPSGQLLRTIVHSAAVNAVAFAPTGHDLVSGAVDGSLLITRDDHDPIVLRTSPSGVDAAAILADGRVVVADASQRLRVINPDHNSLLMDVPIPNRVRLLRASQDSKRLVTIFSTRSKQAPLVLWDLEQYFPLAQLDGHVGRVFTARFVATGILTAGRDGTVRLWDAATGSLRRSFSFRGDSSFLVDATLSPDGSVVVAGASDGSLRFWDASDGRMLWTMQAHKSYVVGVHYEGNDIVTRGFAGDISRWTLPQPHSVIEACLAAGCAAPLPVRP